MRCFTDIRLLAATMLVCMLVGGCSKPPDSRAPLDVSFDWTCDAHGRLEPCGCFTGQNGGLTRVSTLLHTPPAAGAPLLADVGNAIAGTADYQVIQYRYMQKAFASMGYQALNVGEREAGLSVAELGKLRDASPVPMVSANLLDRASGQRVFPPYRIVQVSNYRVAFLGVLGDVPEENLGAGLVVEPMKPAIARVLPEIMKHADVIVLLAFADEAAMRSLADEFYELDLILGGKVKEPSQKLTRQNRSVVLWTTNETKAFGTLRTRIAGRGRLAVQDFNILFVDEKIPQDQKLTRLAQGYRDEVRRTPLAVDDPAHAGPDDVPGVRPSVGYVGSESCAECHAQSYRVWQNTGHAHAFESLAVRGSDADPNCIGCHTVGFGTPSGYRREWLGRRLAGVGCENCHGPGSEHVAERRRLAASPGVALFHYRPVGAADCAACHYGEFSRPFDYAVFWPAVQHGKESRIRRLPPGPGPVLTSYKKNNP